MFPTHRINTGKTCRNSFQRKLYFQKKQFATQNGKYPQKTSGVQEMVLRNIAPREGTETITGCRCPVTDDVLRNIAPREGTETSSTVTSGVISVVLRNIAPREGTETFRNFDKLIELSIKKYSSPRGDGNSNSSMSM